MASWNSPYWSVIHQVLGWFAFTVWSISFYPQVLLNYRRKSVVGLNFDFILLNFTKHSSYLIYNAAVFFSPVVQRQYHEKYGADEMIPVAPNDVAFSVHAVLLTTFTIFQAFLYEKGGQKISKPGILISAAAWLTALICLIIAFPSGSWFWLVSIFNIIQVVMTAIKYIPQAWMNFRRKSTVGWSIGNILLDISGGVANLLQMVVQSIDQHSTENFSGNFGKLGLSLESIAFDILFILQHYALYPDGVKLELEDKLIASTTSDQSSPDDDPENPLQIPDDHQKHP